MMHFSTREWIFRELPRSTSSSSCLENRCLACAQSPSIALNSQLYGALNNKVIPSSAAFSRTAKVWWTGRLSRNRYAAPGCSWRARRCRKSMNSVVEIDFGLIVNPTMAPFRSMAATTATALKDSYFLCTVACWPFRCHTLNLV